MTKKWVALFQFEDRSFLQDNLNQFINEHENCELNIWTDSGMWYGQVMYEYKDRKNDNDPTKDKEASESP